MANVTSDGLKAANVNHLLPRTIHSKSPLFRAITSVGLY